MMLRCTVCNAWYPTDGRGILDVCGPCFDLNFSGNLLEAPTARQALDAYVSSAQQMTPRQRAAMVRLTDIWEAEAQRRQAGGRNEGVRGWEGSQGVRNEGGREESECSPLLAAPLLPAPFPSPEDA